MNRASLKVLLWVTFSLAGAYPLQAAATLDQLIAGARKEGVLDFVAGASTFGGKKGVSELEAAFNKKFGLKARIQLTAGPSMPAVAARILTEIKAGRTSSTDFYLGSTSHFADLHQQKALDKVNWSGLFPWITKEMELVLNEGVLVYTSPQGIVYNSNIIPADKAPRSYEDLIDPRLTATWQGKLAIPPYPDWLSELTLIWGKEKVKDFTRKLLPLAGGRLRYNEEERVISGEFPIMANMSGAIERMWHWQAQGAPLMAVPASTPALTYYFMLGVPKNSAHPNLAVLFVGFMLSKEAQKLLQKYDSRSSHLVEGTRTAKYLREKGIKLLTSKELLNFYLTGEGPTLQEEFDKMLKQ